MKWLVRIAVLYLVTLAIMFAAVAFAGSGPGTPSHQQMNPVSHSDYELHKSIGHIT